MPFWSKKKQVDSVAHQTVPPQTQRDAPASSRVQELVQAVDLSSQPSYAPPSPSPYDERFRLRYQELKDLEEEYVNRLVTISDLDDQALLNYYRKLQRIADLVDEHKRDSEEEIKLYPGLLDAHPTLFTMLDRFVSDSEVQCRAARFSIERRKRFGQWTLEDQANGAN